jgi:hypothetical protein
MIESKEALTENFLRLAAQFEGSQNPVTGIDLDDAIVKLKRYALSQERNEELAQLLHEMGRLVRSRNMDAYPALLRQIRDSL